MADVKEKVTKKRSANFSTAECLLLAEIMGSESGMEGLTFHAYTKHRFTNSEYYLLISIFLRAIETVSVTSMT
ncbi:hypothetical protein DPMN_038900 [Dreissena polymorpha]|uniref:Uncharacterized protein n=1 Tax=Dreissena polymorpha TaxID=45954 RepID=A0A9D4MGD5_DREPO|nr:hypothetical protein DPMN_038900 [Dreissena polymorpha]